MANFFDTSVFIGYTYCDDDWRVASEGMLQGSSMKLTSDRAKNEYLKKHRYFQRVRRGGLIQLRDRIADSVGCGSATLSSDEVENLVPQIQNDERNTEWLRSTAKKLAKKSSYKVEICNRIDRFMDNYFRFSTERMGQVIKWCSPDVMIIECCNRYVQYPDILEIFEGNGMQNGDDNEIILDAHDFCKLCNESMDLVTGDYKDYKQHEAVIVSNTDINSVIYLGDC